MSGDGFDAVVVGAGPNGLVGAVTLADAGLRVLVLDASDRPGGCLRTEALTLPGFRHDVGATVLPMALASAAFRGLGLESDGLMWRHAPIPVAQTVTGEDAVVVRNDLEETAHGLGRDAAVWRRVVGGTAAAGLALVDTLLDPLNLPRVPARALRFGAVAALPATTVMRHLFRTERGRALFAGMAAHSVLSLDQLITSGYGILLASLAHSVGWPVVEGGAERLSDVLCRRILAAGGEIRTGVRVTSLAQVPSAHVVLLNVSPRQAVQILGPDLPPGYRRALSRFRHASGVFKLDWALDAPMPWRDARLQGAGTVHVAAHAREIVESERAAASGGRNERPFVLAVQPTAADPARAPAGKHILWAYCHVPNGSQQDYTDAVERQIERHAPGFRDRVLGRHVMPPHALEAFNANLVGGDVVGGAGDLRQFLARPVLSLRPWDTPVESVYLCSASTPPGGGVHGMGGLKAARLALRKL